MINIIISLKKIISGVFKIIQVGIAKVTGNAEGKLKGLINLKSILSEAQKINLDDTEAKQKINNLYEGLKKLGVSVQAPFQGQIGSAAGVSTQPIEKISSDIMEKASKAIIKGLKDDKINKHIKDGKITHGIDDYIGKQIYGSAWTGKDDEQKKQAHQIVEQLNGEIKEYPKLAKKLGVQIEKTGTSFVESLNKYSGMINYAAGALQVAGAAITAWALTIEDKSTDSTEKSKVGTGWGQIVSGIGSGAAGALIGVKMGAAGGPVGMVAGGIIGAVVSGVGSIVSGITTLIDGYDYTIKERLNNAKKEREELEQIAAEKTNNYTTLKQTLEQINKLASNRYNSAEDMEAYNNKLLELNENYPGLISAMSGTNDAVLQASRAERQLAQERLKAAGASADLAAQEAKINYLNALAEYEDIQTSEYSNFGNPFFSSASLTPQDAYTKIRGDRKEAKMLDRDEKLIEGLTYIAEYFGKEVFGEILSGLEYSFSGQYGNIDSLNLVLETLKVTGPEGSDPNKLFLELFGFDTSGYSSDSNESAVSLINKAIGSGQYTDGTFYSNVISWYVNGDRDSLYTKLTGHGMKSNDLSSFLGREKSDWEKEVELFLKSLSIFIYSQTLKGSFLSHFGEGEDADKLKKSVDTAITYLLDENNPLVSTDISAKDYNSAIENIEANFGKLYQAVILTVQDELMGSGYLEYLSYYQTFIGSDVYAKKQEFEKELLWKENEFLLYQEEYNDIFQILKELAYQNYYDALGGNVAIAYNSDGSISPRGKSALNGAKAMLSEFLGKQNSYEYFDELLYLQDNISAFEGKEDLTKWVTENLPEELHDLVIGMYQRFFESTINRADMAIPEEFSFFKDGDLSLQYVDLVIKQLEEVDNLTEKGLKTKAKLLETNYGNFYSEFAKLDRDTSKDLLFIVGQMSFLDEDSIENTIELLKEYGIKNNKEEEMASLIEQLNNAKNSLFFNIHTQVQNWRENLALGIEAAQKTASGLTSGLGGSEAMEDFQRISNGEDIFSNLYTFDEEKERWVYTAEGFSRAMDLFHNEIVSAKNDAEQEIEKYKNYLQKKEDGSYQFSKAAWEINSDNYLELGDDALALKVLYEEYLSAEEGTWNSWREFLTNKESLINNELKQALSEEEAYNTLLFHFLKEGIDFSDLKNNPKKYEAIIKSAYDLRKALVSNFDEDEEILTDALAGNLEALQQIFGNVTTQDIIQMADYSELESYANSIKELLSITDKNISNLDDETKNLLVKLGLLKIEEDQYKIVGETWGDLVKEAKELLGDINNLAEASRSEIVKNRTILIQDAYGINDINKNKNFLSKGGVYTAEELSDFLGDNWSSFFDATTGKLTSFGEALFNFKDGNFEVRAGWEKILINVLNNFGYGINEASYDFLQYYLDNLIRNGEDLTAFIEGLNDENQYSFLSSEERADLIDKARDAQKTENPVSILQNLLKGGFDDQDLIDARNNAFVAELLEGANAIPNGVTGLLEFNAESLKTIANNLTTKASELRNSGDIAGAETLEAEVDTIAETLLEMGDIAGFFEITGLTEKKDIRAIKNVALTGKTSALTKNQLEYWDKYKDQIASYYSTTSQSILEEFGKIVTSDLKNASFDVTGFENLAIFQDDKNFTLVQDKYGRVTAYLAEGAEITFEEYEIFLIQLGIAWDRRNELLMQFNEASSADAKALEDLASSPYLKGNALITYYGKIGKRVDGGPNLEILTPEKAEALFRDNDYALYTYKQNLLTELLSIQSILQNGGTISSDQQALVNALTKNEIELDDYIKNFVFEIGTIQQKIEDHNERFNIDKKKAAKNLLTSNGVIDLNSLLEFDEGALDANNELIEKYADLFRQNAFGDYVLNDGVTFSEYFTVFGAEIKEGSEEWVEAYLSWLSYLTEQGIKDDTINLNTDLAKVTDPKDRQRIIEAYDQYKEAIRVPIINAAYGIDKKRKSRDFLSKGGVYSTEDLVSFLNDAAYKKFFDAEGELTDVGSLYLKQNDDGDFEVKKGQWYPFMVTLSRLGLQIDMASYEFLDSRLESMIRNGEDLTEFIEGLSDEKRYTYLADEDRRKLLERAYEASEVENPIPELEKIISGDISEFQLSSAKDFELIKIALDGVGEITRNAITQDIKWTTDQLQKIAENLRTHASTLRAAGNDEEADLVQEQVDEIARGFLEKGDIDGFYEAIGVQYEGAIRRAIQTGKTSWLTPDAYDIYLKWYDDLAQYYTASAQSIGESILDNLINGAQSRFSIAGFEDNKVLQEYLYIQGTDAKIKPGIGFEEFSKILKSLPGMTDDLYASLIKQYHDALDKVKNAKKEIANSGNITFDNLLTIYGTEDFPDIFSEVWGSYYFTSQDAMKEFFKDSPELLKTYQLQLVSKLISISEKITDESIKSLTDQEKAILAEAGISIGEDIDFSTIPELITDFINNIWAEAENTVENRIKAYENANQVETKKARSSLLTSFGSIDVNDLMAFDASAIQPETNADGITTYEMSKTYADLFKYDDSGNLRVKSDVTFDQYWDTFSEGIAEYSTEWVESYTAWLAYRAENGMETSLLDLEMVLDNVENGADKEKIFEAYTNYFGSFDKGVEKYLTAIEELTASTTNGLSDVSVETRTLLWSLGIVKQAEDGSYKLADGYRDLGSAAAQLYSELINTGDATSDQLAQAKANIVSQSYGINKASQSNGILNLGGSYSAYDLLSIDNDKFFINDENQGDGSVRITASSDDYLYFDEKTRDFKVVQEKEQDYLAWIQEIKGDQEYFDETSLAYWQAILDMVVANEGSFDYFIGLLNDSKEGLSDGVYEDIYQRAIDQLGEETELNVINDLISNYDDIDSAQWIEAKEKFGESLLKDVGATYNEATDSYSLAADGLLQVGKNLKEKRAGFTFGSEEYESYSENIDKIATELLNQGKTNDFFYLTGLTPSARSKIMKVITSGGDVSHLTTKTQREYWQKYGEDLSNYYSISSKSLADTLLKVFLEGEGGQFEITGFEDIIELGENFEIITEKDGRSYAYLTDNAVLSYDAYKAALESLHLAEEVKTRYLLDFNESSSAQAKALKALANSPYYEITTENAELLNWDKSSVGTEGILTPEDAKELFEGNTDLFNTYRVNLLTELLNISSVYKAIAEGKDVSLTTQQKELMTALGLETEKALDDYISGLVYDIGTIQQEISNYNETNKIDSKRAAANILTSVGSLNLEDLMTFDQTAINGKELAKKYSNLFQIDAFGEHVLKEGVTFDEYFSTFGEGIKEGTEEWLQSYLAWMSYITEQGIEDSTINLNSALENVNDEDSRQQIISAHKQYNEALIETREARARGIFEEIESLTELGAGESKDISQIIASGELEKTLKLLTKQYGVEIQNGIMTIGENTNVDEVINILTTAAQDAGLLLENDIYSLTDSIREALYEIANIVTNGIAGTMNAKDVATLKEQYNLVDADFYETTEGIKLVDDAVLKIYTDLKEVNTLASEVVLTELVNSTKEADEGWNDILTVNQRIFEINKKIEEAGENTSRRKILESELEIAKQIKEELLQAGNAFNFMDDGIPTDLTNPLSAWTALGTVEEILVGDDFKEGKMTFENFRNIVTFWEEANVLVTTAAGEKVHAAEMLAYAEDATNEVFTRIGGEAYIDLNALGTKFLIGAEDYSTNTSEGIKVIAENQIKRLTGLRNILVGLQTTEEIIENINNGASLEEEQLRAVGQAFIYVGEYAGLSFNEAFKQALIYGQITEEQLSIILPIVKQANDDIDLAVEMAKSSWNELEATTEKTTWLEYIKAGGAKVSEVIGQAWENIKTNLFGEATITVETQEEKAASAMENLASTLANVTEKAINHINNLQAATDSLTSKTITISFKTPSELSATPSYITTNHNSLPTAVAKAKGNLAYAKGTLMGELGPELVVSGGRYFTVGNNGAEFVDLPSDAIVFNHMQTQKLLKNGSISSTGEPAVSERKSVALAGGNVSGPAKASVSDSIARIDELIRIWQNIAQQSAFDLASKAGGGGGGGGDEAGNTGFITDLERWYNLLRQIEKLEQQINYLQAERENLISGYDYVDNLEKELRLLQKQQQAYSKLAELQKSYYDRRREDLLKTDYSKIFTYDEDGLMQYVDGKGFGLDILATLNATDEHGVAKMTAKQQVQYLKNNGFDISQFMRKADGTKIESTDYTGILEEFWSGIDNWMDELDGLYDEYNDHMTSIEDNQQAQNKILQEYVDNQLSIEDKLLQAIEEREQAEIDKLQENLDALSNAASQYIEGLNDALKKEREMYSQNEEDAETVRLQRQLAILQRSGGSASEIKSLQDQLDSRLQESYFSEQERQIQAVQDASDAQIEKLQQQLDIMNEALEYQKENGLLWQEVSDMMYSWTPEAMMDFIEKYTASYKSDSTLANQEASKETLKELEIWDAKRIADERNAMWKTYLEDAQNRYDEMTIYKGELAANEAYLSALKEGQSEGEASAAADAVFQGIVDNNNKLANEAANNSAQTGKDTSSEKKKYYIATYSSLMGQDKKTGKYTSASSAKAAAEKAIDLDTQTYYENNPNVPKTSYIGQAIQQWKKNIKVSAYKHGGLVDFTGPAWVDGTKSKPEAFLSAEDTALLKSKIFSNSDYSLKSAIEAIEALGRQFTSIDNSSVQEGITFENVTVQIQSGTISSDYDARRAGELALEEMMKIARRSSNIGVARR